MQLIPLTHFQSTPLAEPQTDKNQKKRKQPSPNFGKWFKSQPVFDINKKQCVKVRNLAFQGLSFQVGIVPPSQMANLESKKRQYEKIKKTPPNPHPTLNKELSSFEKLKKNIFRKRLKVHIQIPSPVKIIPENPSREVKDLAFKHFTRPFGIRVQTPAHLLPYETKRMKFVLDNCYFYPYFPSSVTSSDKTVLMVNGSFKIQLPRLNNKSKKSLKDLHHLMNSHGSIFKEDFSVNYPASKVNFTDVFCTLGLKGYSAETEPGFMAANERSQLNWNPNYHNVYLSLQHQSQEPLFGWLYAIDEKGQQYRVQEQQGPFLANNLYTIEIPKRLLPSVQKIRLLFLLTPSQSKDEVDRIMKRQFIEKSRLLPRAQDRVLQFWYILNPTCRRQREWL